MEKLREERNHLERLRELRDEWSDEIPEEMVNSLSPKKKFKVRRGWWQGVVGGLWNALRTGQIPDSEVQTEVKKFIEHYTSEEFHTQPLTTAEDIEKANKIIDMVLGDKT